MKTTMTALLLLASLGAWCQHIHFEYDDTGNTTSYFQAGDLPEIRISRDTIRIDDPEKSYVLGVRVLGQDDLGWSASNDKSWFFPIQRSYAGSDSVYLSVDLETYEGPDQGVLLIDAPDATNGPLRVTVIAQFEAPLSVEDPTNGVTIYPNPTTGLVSIQIEDGMEPFETISLIDYRGSEVMHKRVIPSADTQVDLSRLPNGIYLLILTGKQEQFQRKVLISN